MVQNVQSNNGFLTMCSSSLNVVVFNAIMLSVFLDPMVSALTHLRQRYEVPDEIAYCSRRTQTYYSLQFAASVLLPLIATTLLDECVCACMPTGVVTAAWL